MPDKGNIIQIHHLFLPSSILSLYRLLFLLHLSHPHLFYSDINIYIHTIAITFIYLSLFYKQSQPSFTRPLVLQNRISML
ncbi:hypothetical protein FB192DRAFT_1401089 [Mucor lusitanicus]|uniref:Uncharacterized protein n=1 Tax=Mucor circinelloides f. lusitanicus TaxID=29924 RepID=A0A8H4B9A9_MUCCL|nr:hypothetical protein FB192DRAFT_1401089 [Mucor lusitanicus]